MDCAGLPENLRYEKHSPEKMVSIMVGALIAKNGYHTVINELIAAVFNLGEISLAEPANSAKLRDFDLWAHAIRAAVLKHDYESSFERRITDFDRLLAKQMGIIVS